MNNNIPKPEPGRPVDYNPNQYTDVKEAHTIYAVISIRDDGNEGLCSVQLDDGRIVPLITERYENIQHLRGHAARMAKHDKKTRVVIRAYSDYNDIETFEP